MLFKSDAVSATWDTWMVYYDGVYYLYYIISGKSIGEGFGVATSVDGVRWNDHGQALGPSEKMVDYLGTGSVWQDPDFANTGRFFCNYSEWRVEGDQHIQNIFFAWSQDLIRWHKFGDDMMFKVDERFYAKIDETARQPWQRPRWDGIAVIPRPAGGYYGYWTATPKDFLGFGFGESLDGIHWHAQQPPRIEWGNIPEFYFIEVGAVHKFGDRYYAMLADYADPHCGMFAFVSDSPHGPFRPSTRNLDLLRNQSRMHAYFARFLDAPDGVLVNHHTLSGEHDAHGNSISYFAPLKKAEVMDEVLYLTWWTGNNGLKSRKIEQHMSGDRVLRFEPDRGIVLEGVMEPPGRLSIGSSDGTGIEIRVNEKGIVEIGTTDLGGTVFDCQECIDRETTFGTCPQFRLLLRHNMLEFYLDDLFIQCYTMEKPPSGEVSCQSASDLHLWQWS
ncbi:MAG: hypothetical protein JXA89_01930 [Anaerolineae bacterium]|nr:hypothetical protein [Anaerolineae bacterium]